MEKSNLLALYNPLKDTFSYPIRDETNALYTLEMFPGEITYFQPHEWVYMRKHLAEAIYHLEGNPKRDRDLEMAEIYKRIEVQDVFD